MALDKTRFTDLIKNFKFKELFNELGWDHYDTEQLISIEDQKFKLKAVSEKRGFVVFICSPDSASKIPPYNFRKQIDAKITKLYFEHLIIYTDKSNSQQIWQLVIREPDKPVVVRETPYFPSQQPDLLFQRLRGIFISLDDEEKITLTDIGSKVREQFNTNAEKVTKKFYQEFKNQHTAFLKFIEGIESVVDKEWYASLMLNRLMFIYFIQKKGFLDNNINYLSDKLRETKKKKGENKFYNFYRNFLLVLFHKGFGLPENERTKEIIKEIGKVPYLNGGLFDEHQLEKNYEIEIKDRAFEKIFNFFDEYNWHLDTRITATGRDINPDVIGYIFEKYINDRAAMGAYYTKEDITEYIAKNTIIPYLFDEVKKGCAEAFKDDSSLWKMLRDNPDRYIYDAVKHGIYESVIASPDEIGTKQSQLTVRELPKEISIGLDTTKPNLLERRKEWNKAAPEEYALPTEIWREVVERRKRYFEIKSKIENSEIIEINDFITYNLNIRQFAQDAIEQYEGSDFITAFYKAIKKITILDPTCGSGAFLFAALNILELFYEACISRMRGFIEQDNLASGKKFKNFRDVIEEIKIHPNEKYYIYKSIILNNLYGVDIMNEAVEIAKLRLFLKLVAEVEDFNHLEPLPDIDFNIRTGNTLIGFATRKEINELEGLFVTEKMKTKIFEECELVSKAFKHFKEIQILQHDDRKEFVSAKDNLNTRLLSLKNELDKILHKQLYEGIEYNKWLNTHQPFHWFAEFYEIIESGGFNIIIGNPPYVVYSEQNFIYQIKNYVTLSCANLYAFVSERSLKLCNTFGKFGMILPNSSISADKMAALQKIFYSNSGAWISNFAWRPSKLFEGANMLLAIIILSHKIRTVQTSKYLKWSNEYRINPLLGNILFDTISYSDITNIITPGSIPKLPGELYKKIQQKIDSNNKTIYNFISSRSTKFVLYYFRAVLYWIKILDKKPFFKEDGKTAETGEMKPMYFNSDEERYLFISQLSSSLFFTYYVTWSSCQVINSRDFQMGIDINLLDTKRRQKLIQLGKKLEEDYQRNSAIIKRNYSSRGRSFLMEKQYFYLRYSKNIIDEIDKVLAEHYGFTEEELDFIINYDIKYRMGKELEEED